MGRAAVWSLLLWTPLAAGQSYPDWVNSFGSNGIIDQALSVSLDTDGDLLVGGEFSATVDFDPGPGSSEFTADHTDPFIVKYRDGGSLVWAHHFAGRGRVTDLATDSAGNVLAVGRFSQSLVIDSTLTLQSNHSYDLFAVKLDAGGNLLWAWSIGATGDETPQAIAIDSMGRMAVSGIISTTVDFDPGPGEVSLTTGIDQDSFLALYDSDGQLLWVHLFEQLTANGIATSDSAHALAIADNDDIVVGGLYQGTTTFDGMALTSAATDAYLARFDSTGNRLWVRSSAGAGTRKESFSVARADNGDLVVAGLLFGEMDVDPDPVDELWLTSDGSLDLYLARFASNGDLIWAGRIGNSGTELINDLVVGANDSITIAGRYSGTTDFDPGPGEVLSTAMAEWDAYFAHYSSTGQLIAALPLEGSPGPVNPTSAIESLVANPDGDLIAAGFYERTVDFDPGPGVLDLTPSNTKDAFVARYTAAPPENIFADGFEIAVR